MGLTALLLAAAACSANRDPGMALVPPLTVMADAGPFGTLERAAEAESLVHWRDADPADDRACTGAFAATELREFLAGALGIPEDSISLSPARELPARGTVVLVVSDPSDPRLAAVDTSRAPVLGAGSEAFRIFTDPKRRVLVIQGRDRAGTLYGAYALLDTLGVRFYGPDKGGTIVPPGSARLPRTLCVAAEPGFLTRGFWAWEPRGNAEFFRWMARNRLNLWTAEESPRLIPLLRKLAIRLTKGGHNIQKTFLDPAAAYPYRVRGGPADRPRDPHAPGPEFQGDRNRDGRVSTFEVHPEWYALIGGRRSDAIGFDAGNNFCTSNADAVSELTRNLVLSLEHGDWSEADDVMFWMLDNGGWCSCDRCRAQGTPTDRLFGLVGTVAGAIEVERAAGRLPRRVTLMPLAFLETMPPPTRPVAFPGDREATVVNWFPIDRCYAHALGDPTCTEINTAQVREYQAWGTDPGRTWRGPIGIGEYYNIASFKSLPVVFTRVIATDLPWYFANGARHFHTMHVPTAEWGPLALNHALLARLLWNPHAPADSIRDEYFRLRYPRSQSSMRPFYAHLERATANLKLLKDRVRVGLHTPQLRVQFQRGGYPLPMAHMQWEETHPPENDGPDVVEILEAVSMARAEIDAARAAAPDGPEGALLLEDERRFRYCEATLQFYYHLIRLWLLDLNKDPREAAAQWPRFRDSAATLAAMKDVALAASSHANAKDGLEATGMIEVVRTLERRHGAAR